VHSGSTEGISTNHPFPLGSPLLAMAAAWHYFDPSSLVVVTRGTQQLALLVLDVRDWSDDNCSLSGNSQTRWRQLSINAYISDSECDR